MVYNVRHYVRHYFIFEISMFHQCLDENDFLSYAFWVEDLYLDIKIPVATRESMHCKTVLLILNAKPSLSLCPFTVGTYPEYVPPPWIIHKPLHLLPRYLYR